MNWKLDRKRDPHGGPHLLSSLGTEPARYPCTRRAYSVGIGLQPTSTLAPICAWCSRPSTERSKLWRWHAYGMDGEARGPCIGWTGVLLAEHPGGAHEAPTTQMQLHQSVQIPLPGPSKRVMRILLAPERRKAAKSPESTGRPGVLALFDYAYHSACRRAVIARSSGTRRGPDRESWLRERGGGGYALLCFAWGTLSSLAESSWFWRMRTAERGNGADLTLAAAAPDCGANTRYPMSPSPRNAEATTPRTPA